MLVGTWNINSIKSRKEQVIQLLREKDITILALQETKVKTEEFPFVAFKNLGYHVYHSGGKGKNGVAILSKVEVVSNLKDFEELEKDGLQDIKERLIGVEIFYREERVWIFSVYIPNGGTPESDYYYYKLKFFWKLKEYLESNFSSKDNLIIMGDFNVAPLEIDVYDKDLLAGSICFTEKERKAFTELLSIGLYDALRVKYPDKKGIFTWWDYQFSAFKKNLGMRLDHILVSSGLVEKIEDVWVEKSYRGLPKPSDHAPLLAKLKL